MRIPNATGTQCAQLCRDFPQLFRHTQDISLPVGWIDLVRELAREMHTEADRSRIQPRILQIREKFAGLRVSVAGGNDEIERLVKEVNERSFKTCANCGSGEDVRLRLARNGWRYTVCDNCVIMQALAGESDSFEIVPPDDDEFPRSR
jgi:hypothetical protein